MKKYTIVYSYQSIAYLKIYIITKNKVTIARRISPIHRRRLRKSKESRKNDNDYINTYLHSSAFYCHKKLLQYHCLHRIHRVTTVFVLVISPLYRYKKMFTLEPTKQIFFNLFMYTNHSYNARFYFFFRNKTTILVKCTPE